LRHFDSLYKTKKKKKTEQSGTGKSSRKEGGAKNLDREKKAGKIRGTKRATEIKKKKIGGLSWRGLYVLDTAAISEGREGRFKKEQVSAPKFRNALARCGRVKVEWVNA